MNEELTMQRIDKSDKCWCGHQKNIGTPFCTVCYGDILVAIDVYGDDITFAGLKKLSYVKTETFDWEWYSWVYNEALEYIKNKDNHIQTKYSMADLEDNFDGIVDGIVDNYDECVAIVDEILTSRQCRCWVPKFSESPFCPNCIDDLPSKVVEKLEEALDRYKATGNVDDRTDFWMAYSSADYFLELLKKRRVRGSKKSRVKVLKEMA